MVEKTWINFITHFRQAHQELRDTDTSMAELGFQSANAIVEQIVGRLREEEDNGNPPAPALTYDKPPGFGPDPSYELPPAEYAPPP